MKTETSATGIKASFSKKSNARQYPFLLTDMGPYGKPTMRIYYTPYQNKSFTLPMKNKASKADWDSEKKRFSGSKFLTENKALDTVERLYTENYQYLTSIAAVQEMAKKMRKVATSVLDGTYSQKPARATRKSTRRRHGFPVLSVPRKNNGPVGCNPTAKVEVITPEAAAEMLKNGVKNRTLSKSKIAQYADDMRNGRWCVTGKCIDINTNGQLQEGFHRLTAVVEAGVPVKMMVARGVAPEAVTVYDCGILRNATHVMQVTDSKNPSVVASIVKLHTILRNNGRVLSKDTKRKVLNNQQVHDTYMADQKGYEEAAVVGIKYNKQFGVFTKSWAGAIYYYLTVDCHYPRKAVTDFYDSLFTMDTGKVQQADQLRKTMTNLMSKKYKISDETRWAFFAKAWNAYVAGISVKRLKMLADGEEVPAVAAKK